MSDETKSLVKQFITWEKIAVVLVSLLIGILSIVGSIVQGELKHFRTSINQLNHTLSDMRTHMETTRLMTENLNITQKEKMDRLENWSRRLSDRVLELERAR